MSISVCLSDNSFYDNNNIDMLNNGNNSIIILSHTCVYKCKYKKHQIVKVFNY